MMPPRSFVSASLFLLACLSGSFLSYVTAGPLGNAEDEGLIDWTVSSPWGFGGFPAWTLQSTKAGAMGLAPFVSEPSWQLLISSWEFPVEATDRLTGFLPLKAGDEEVLTDRPLPKCGWYTEQPLPASGANPLLLFGRVSESDKLKSLTDSGINGYTGMAWKQPLGAGAEVEFNAGPTLTYADGASPDAKQVKDPLPLHSRWLRLEGLCRWSVNPGVSIEVQGAACPSLNTWERDVINQELRVVLPVGHAGQLRFGAAHSWESAGGSKQSSEGSQLYGGFRVGW